MRVFTKLRKTEEIIKKNGHQLLFLPPYSADLNPIEKCWAIQCDSIYSRIESVFQTN